MSKIYWDKIRLLVTNYCNYHCSFCHNEGQSQRDSAVFMDYSTFERFVEIIKDQEISELCFSGGEPFLNPNLVQMIEYADKSLACEIGCASNLSLISEEQIRRLSKTRVKFNVQFPYVTPEKFHRSTGNGDMDRTVGRIMAVKNAGIAIGLNTVVQSKSEDDVRNMVLFALDSELPLKFLPQIGLFGSGDFKGFVYPILKEYAVEYYDKGTGATKWLLEHKNHKTTVLYIDSPCFTQDIERCKKYGEIRILPDMYIQTCILKNKTIRLNLEDDKTVAQKQLIEIWKNFNHC